MKKTLRNRPLDSSLVLINQKNYTIYGDLVITGQLIIINSTLTIKGNLSILKNPSLNEQVYIFGSSLYIDKIDASEIDIKAKDSTINVEFLGCKSIDGKADILSSGDIFISENSSVGSINAKNYKVGGNNCSEDISCFETTIICGNSNSKVIRTKKLHIGGDADFGGTTICVGYFTSNGRVTNCYGNSFKK